MSFDASYPHSLAPLPPRVPLTNADFSDLLLSARVELAELKGASGLIPNPLLLTAPVLLRESVASSNIENINTTVADVLQMQLFPEAEQREPDKEVLRYRTAMFWGVDHLEKYALSSRIIAGIQSNLMAAGSGGYRREQNRIINLATYESLYTPPPAQNIPGLIANWENYANDSQTGLDPLIQTIICHYQFEAIHPFRDGNGRTGRILMILQLIQNGILNLPVLYISGYINRHRPEYYRRLLDVTTHESWHEYIKFMLTGFFEQAKETRTNLERVSNLLHAYKERVRNENPKIYTADLVEAIFSYPVITPTKLASITKKHYMTTSRYLKQLSEMGILKESVVGKYHLYANQRLLEILKT